MRVRPPAPPLRLVPFPFRAMVSICSDLDETPDRSLYWETARFLNTFEETSIGPGVGLEVANSIYFDALPGEFSYWNTDDRGRAMVRTLIRSGHVDCLHSFGDRVTSRADCARAIEELDRHGCRIEVWVDHRTAPSNLGYDIMQGRGDAAGSPVFHADLSVAAGLTYAWRGRVTSVFGQNVRPRFRATAPSGRSARRAVAVAKEVVKRLAARLGSAKYAMHGANQVLRPIRLRSGQAVYEFMRSDPSPRGIGVSDGLAGLAERLAPAALRALAESGGVSLVYTHLGKLPPGVRRCPGGTLDGLRRLADEQRAGRILVAATRRVLGYCRALSEVQVEIEEASGRQEVLRVTRRTTPVARRLERADLDGLTLYVRDPARCSVLVDGVEEPGVIRNPPDETGRASVMLPWRRLTFPNQ
ncbi:MAG: hypothetical protein KBA95_03870 [Acidobacteria bacterium]|nr:hypothetical protein [Acidobacteriota bacterium]